MPNNKYPYVPRYENIKDTIQSYAEKYVMLKPGRGPTHYDAYREGARKAIELFTSGQYSLEDVTSTMV